MRLVLHSSHYKANQNLKVTKKTPITSSSILPKLCFLKSSILLSFVSFLKYISIYKKVWTLRMNLLKGVASVQCLQCTGSTAIMIRVRKWTDVMITTDPVLQNIGQKRHPFFNIQKYELMTMTESINGAGFFYILVDGVV